jgi:hypothetical protein
MEQATTQKPPVGDRRAPSHKRRGFRRYFAITLPPALRRGLLIGYFAVTMLPAALFGIWVGVTDLVSASSLLSRLFGASLVVVGIMLVAGFAAILWRLPWRRELVLLACIAGAFTAMAFVVIQVVGYDINLWIAIWLSAGILLATGAVVSVRSGARATPLKKLGAILSAGTLIGLAQLYSSSAYLPSTQEPSVSISATLSKAGSRNVNGQDAHALALNGETRVKNLSGSRVAILGSAFLLVGVKRGPEPRPLDDSNWFAKVKTAFEESHEVSRLVQDEDMSVLASGIIYGTGYTLSPNEEDVFSTTLYAPTKGFDSVFLKVNIVTARADRLKLADSPIDTNLADDPPTEVWDEYRIDEASLVNRLTRERRYLHTGWLLKSDTLVLLPDLNVYVDAESRRNKELSEYNKRLKQLYGIDDSSATSAVSLWR